jgi:D-alanyl-D-alanine-carboxypeptidase/D-alanyl-D-alanine-endopeptidase
MKPLFLHYMIAGFLLMSAFFISCKQKNIPPSTPQEAIDRIVEPYIALGADVGMIVGVVENGQVSIYSYGEKVLGGKEKISSASVLELASLTKVYTGLALAEMHRRGEVNLDDPIDNYLPPTYHVPSYNGTKITLRHLATHTSGFPRYPSNINADAYNMYNGYTEDMMIDYINHVELSREPGSKEEYSNVGYGLLGYILSLKNHSDYETMLLNRVLYPLGIMHTTVSFTPNQVSNLVQGYNGTKQVESWAKYQQNIFQGTGSLISSMEDQLIFLQANMGLISTPLDSAILLSHNPSGNPDAIGLGWNKKTSDGLHIIHKNGNNGGYGTFIGFDKQKKIGVVVMANSSLNPELFQTDIGFEILKTLNTF